jgi:hypothetical protein
MAMAFVVAALVSVELLLHSQSPAWEKILLLLVVCPACSANWWPHLASCWWYLIAAQLLFFNAKMSVRFC